MHAKNTKKVRVEPRILKTYLALISRSVGSPMFQEFWCRVNGTETEVTRGGNISCAWFVTAILKIFSLIDTVQITVHRTLDELERSGWERIPRPRVGCIVIWAARPADAARMRKDKDTYYPMVRHLGFYIGKGKAVTNSGDDTLRPAIYPLRYRPIEGYYWTKKLESGNSIRWDRPSKRR